MPIGNPKLKMLRIEARLSQEALSRLSGIHARTISRFETGGKVNDHTVKRISAALSRVLERKISSESLLNREARKPHAGQGNEENQKTVLEKTAELIPNQNSLIKFRVSDSAKLRLVPSLEDENDYETIHAIRSELLASMGPIDRLKERYNQNPNTPQAGLFGPLAAKYDEEISKDPRHINYTILFARGARLYAARRNAAQQVTSGEWPEPSAEEAGAIDAICDLHGPLIMASAAGRRLVADAHEYEATREVYREEESLLHEFGEALASEADLFEPDTIEAIVDITTPIPDDPQPARSRGIRLVLAGSALSVVVGGAAWYAAGGVVVTAVLPAAAVGAVGLGGAFVWEVAKKTDIFRKTTDNFAKKANKFISKSEASANKQHEKMLKKVADLVDRRRNLFERVSNIRPEFGWAMRFIRVGNSETRSTLRRSIAIIGAPGVGKTTFGKALSDQLSVPFLQTEMTILYQAHGCLLKEDNKVIEFYSLSDLRRSLIGSFAKNALVIEIDTRLMESKEFRSFIYQNSVTIVWKMDGDASQEESNKKNAIMNTSSATEFGHIAVSAFNKSGILDVVLEVIEKLKRMRGTFDP